MPTYILQEPIENLPISVVLSSFMKENGFKNLQEVVETGTPGLQRMPGFGIHCMEELLSILDKHNCLHLLKEE
jgi:DNA-directed RNA polymerase alpha subunit